MKLEITIDGLKVCDKVCQKPAVPEPHPTHFMGKPVEYWVELEEAAKEASGYIGMLLWGTKNLQGKTSQDAYNSISKVFSK